MASSTSHNPQPAVVIELLRDSVTDTEMYIGGVLAYKTKSHGRLRTTTELYRVSENGKEELVVTWQTGLLGDRSDKFTWPDGGMTKAGDMFELHRPRSIRYVHYFLLSADNGS
jgi:hypothetical protein